MFSIKACLSIKIVTNILNICLDTVDWHRVYSGRCTSARTIKAHKGKTYTNYLLVESRHTAQGPRQHVICSLGSLAPAPREEWLSLAHRLEASLEGQGSFPPADAPLETLVEKVRRGREPRTVPRPAGPQAGAGLAVEPDRVGVEEAREAAAVPSTGPQLGPQSFSRTPPSRWPDFSNRFPTSTARRTPSNVS